MPSPCLLFRPRPALAPEPHAELRLSGSEHDLLEKLEVAVEVERLDVLARGGLKGLFRERVHLVAVGPAVVVLVRTLAPVEIGQEEVLQVREDVNQGADLAG